MREQNEERLSEKFDRLRRIRNGINYYGKNITVSEVKEHKEEIINIIKELNKKYFDKR